MATKDSKAEKAADKPDPQPDPLPVDVISSVPLSVQIAPESLASLGAPPAGTAEPVTATPTATSQATLTPPAQPASAPVNVTVVAPPPPPATVAKADDLTLTPTTTAADDKVTAGQRLTSLLWESTQATISVAITLAVIYCAVKQINSETITNAFFFIVATYFTRTNHVKIGGVGPKADNGVYRGR